MERRTIPHFPDYAIDATGAVWRMTPSTAQVDARRGETPRTLRPAMRGGWAQHRQPSVTLIAPDRKHKQRLVGRLMRELWPEVEFDWRKGR